MDYSKLLKDRAVIFSDDAKEDIRNLSEKYPHFNKVLKSFQYTLGRAAETGKVLPSDPSYYLLPSNKEFGPMFEALYTIDDRVVKVHGFFLIEDE